MRNVSNVRVVNKHEVKINMPGVVEEEKQYFKTSFSVFVAILYLKVLYILLMTLCVLSRFNETFLVLAVVTALLCM